MTHWHLYAILGQDPGEVRLQGLGGAKVQAIRGGPLWALASERAEHGTNAADPLEHHRVIERALERWALLPARFAAPQSLDALLRRLEHDASTHLAALERVRDSREFSIRAELEPDHAGTASGSVRPEAAPAHANTRLAEFSQGLCEHLTPFALEFAHAYPEPSLYRGSVLVARGRLEAFWHAFAAALEALPLEGVRPSLHGPYSPYSFVHANGEAAA